MSVKTKPSPISRIQVKMWSKVASVFSGGAIVVTEDVSGRYGPLWEKNEDSICCRSCNAPFGLGTNHRHHCRSCAMCYCQECCVVRPTNSNSVTKSSKAFTGDMNKEDDAIRICTQCYRGECSGRALQNIIQLVLTNGLKSRSGSHRKSLSDMLKNDSNGSGASNLVLNLTESEKTAPRRFELSRGERSSIDDPAVSPSMSGLFEFINKSGNVVAIKVQTGRADKNWAIIEAARPSFTVVLPGECVYCSFDPQEGKEGHLDVIVLHDNPNPIIAGERPIIDPRASGVNVDTISPCALITAFRAVSGFKVLATNKNAIVKLHSGINPNEVPIPDANDTNMTVTFGKEVYLLPRIGNAISRIGLMNRIKGLRFRGNEIDMKTNVTLIKSMFTLQS